MEWSVNIYLVGMKRLHRWCIEQKGSKYAKTFLCAGPSSNMRPPQLIKVNTQKVETQI